MAADGSALSVKERLAMLQKGNKNELFGGNIVAHPVSPKEPNLLPNKETKTDFPPLKPSALKPITPSPSSSPAGGGTRPPTALRPPPTALKPTGGGSSDAKGDGQQSSASFPKLRHVESPNAHTPGRLGGGTAPFGSNKPTSPSQESSSGGAARGGDSGGGGGGGDTAVVRDKTESGAAPGKKFTSIQERMEALKKRSSVDNDQGGYPPRAGPAVSANTFGGGGPGKMVNGESSAKPIAGRVGGPVTPPKPSDLIKNINQAAAEKIMRDSSKTDSERQNRRKSGSDVFLRNSDRKKFRQVEVGSVTSSDPAPDKPRPLEGVDLTSFLKAYAAAKEEKINVDAAKCTDGADIPEEDEGELYIEAESSSIPLRTKGGSIKRANTVRISKIPEFTEEEEELEMYTDGASQGRPPPEEEPETYDDCMTEQPPQEEEPDEIYEPLDDLIEEEPEPTTPRIPAIPDEKKKEKDKEKEKEEKKEKEDKVKKKDKAKEEYHKKEEKERKKKEEENKKLRAKFGLADDHQKVGDGVVKANASGGGLLRSKDLPVNKGEIISILRMEGNPTGKWLVENEAGKIGYVNSNNIEIATPTIKNLMAAAKEEDHDMMEEPDEIYEPVADEPDDIYEEV